MKIAALYDVHGNLPALDAVLADVRREGVDRIVVGGDVLPGPMPRETLARLRSLEVAVHFLKGNGDRETLDESPERPSRVPESGRRQLRWCREQLDSTERAAVASWPPDVRLDVPGFGTVLFCHATPRSDEEIVTQLMPDELLRPIYDDVADVVVCGHTHLQYDRRVGATRVVNAGSVGMPFDTPGAYWLMIDAGRPDLSAGASAQAEGLQLRKTSYDLEAGAADVRRTAFPDAEQFASVYMLNPPDMLQMFTQYGLDALKAARHGA
jgi:predicted phosphodiesterase